MCYILSRYSSCLAKPGSVQETPGHQERHFSQSFVPGGKVKDSKALLTVFKASESKIGRSNA